MRQLVFVLLIGTLAACSDDSSGTGAPQSKTDMGLDAQSQTDAERDVAPSSDGGVDVGQVSDASTDATLDAGADMSEVDMALSGNDIDDDNDGFTENQGDCDDTNELISPVAAEICGNTIDDDCDNVVDDGAEGVTTVGPSPYLQASDSPWTNLTFTNFVLEDFEDQMLPAGVTASTFRWGSSFGLAIVESVDGDDGDPTNGVCNPCEAVWSSSSVTFTFDPTVLGQLPTHVGLVVTDAFTANVSVNLSASSACTALGALTSDITFGDGSIRGETAEDRFVGFISPAGISSITISVGGPLEIDHLQFGW